MTRPLISTVILNWNRAYLLEQTLYSYMETITCQQELWIVDNHSTDHSRNVIEAFMREYPETKVVWLNENRGGEAYNEVIPKLAGDFIYLSENDQIHMPGWCEKIIHSFRSYPWLGQLSLHAPVPTDAEAWVTKPVKPRFKNGCLLYELEGNVTTSCIIRRELFQKGLRLHNIANPDSTIRLPDDARLSADVKQMGYWVAYSDHYYVRNIGHETQEMEQHPDYYQSNYAAKKWMTSGELADRMQLQKQLSYVQRHSFLFPGEYILGELSSQPVGELSPRYWSMFDSQTPEMECVEFIHALVRMVKPSHVLETGGWIGHCTIAVAQALAANGLGQLTSVEDNKQAYAYLAERVEHLYLTNVQVRNDKSERFHTQDSYDFVLFNSVYEDQEEEFYHIVPHLKAGATLVFLNSRNDTPSINSLPRTLEKRGLLHGQHFATPRGIYVGTYQPQQPPESRRIIFGFSAGRSGTQFLTSLLKGIPGLLALHEPEPKYQWQTVPLQAAPELPLHFITSEKLPWIQQLPPGDYFEASHYMYKGFLEAWVANGIIPDVIVMERDIRKTALSWYSLNVDFVENPNYVIRHMLHPEDKRQLFLPLKDWRTLNNYQLCYWYVLESRKRAEYYSQYLSGQGARIFHTSLEKLTQGQDIEALLQWLNVTVEQEGMEIIRRRTRQRVNDKDQFKNDKRLESIKDMNLEALEAEVRQQCAIPD